MTNILVQRNYLYYYYYYDDDDDYYYYYYYYFEYDYYYALYCAHLGTSLANFPSYVCCLHPTRRHTSA